MRRQTARFDRFSCICTIWGAKCATEAYFEVFRGVLLIAWCVPCSIGDVLKPDVVRNEPGAFARKNALRTLLKWAANNLHTGCKRTANEVQTDAAEVLKIPLKLEWRDIWRDSLEGQRIF